MRPAARQHRGMSNPAPLPASRRVARPALPATCVLATVLLAGAAAALGPAAPADVAQRRPTPAATATPSSAPASTAPAATTTAAPIPVPAPTPGRAPGPAPAGAPAPAAWVLPLPGAPDVVRPFSAPASEWGPGHRGVDLAAPAGAVARAAGPGVVAWAGKVAGRGVVSVAHAGGLRTTYEPVLATVVAGTPVPAGAPLGLLDGEAPGHCPGRVCLHWGLRRDGSYLDPMALLGGAGAVLLPFWAG